MMKFHYIAIVHAHQKHVRFVFHPFLPHVSCTIHLCFFLSVFDLGYSPSLTHAQPPLQNNVHPCSCVVPSMHTKSMLVLFSSVSPSYFMSIYPFFIHFPHFHILILVIGHMTTIPPLFCHAQPPLQNNVHPCSSVIPSMHTKSMLVLFFIRFSLQFPVHLSFFYLFPSFPYFDLRYWPHDNYPSPLLPCTTSPSKQCSSMFMCCSIHAHQKHVSFVFIRFSLLFHVHLSFFYPFPSFPYFDLRYWPHDNYPSPLLPCTTSPSKQCSSMFMCCSIHAHQKHVSFVFHPFLPPISCPSILFLSISLISIF